MSERRLAILDLAGGADEIYGEAHDVHSEPVSEQLYDVILAGTTLATVEFQEFGGSLATLAGLLVENGQLHVYMPSLDWAMREVLGGRISPGMFLHLWGTPDHKIRCAFRLIDLRELFWSSGLATARADTVPYDVAKSGAGDVLRAEMHYLVGFKGDWKDAPDVWVRTEPAADPIAQ